MEKENKGRAIALLPIGVIFNYFFSARGIVFQDFLCDAGNCSFFDRIVCCIFAE